MIGQEVLNAQFGQTEEASSLRIMFLEFAVELDEILPDNDSKRSCIGQIRYAMENAIEAMAIQVQRQERAASMKKVLDDHGVVPTDLESDGPQFLRRDEEQPELARSLPTGVEGDAAGQDSEETDYEKYRGAVDDPGSFKGGFE